MIVVAILRLVLDSNVMVAALRSDRGASRKLLMSALHGGIRVLASVPLMIEYEAVLTRSEHLLASGLSIGEINSVLNAFAAVAKPVQLHFLWRPRLRDTADEMVLETAVNGRANRLVTFNLRDLKPAAKEFGIPVVAPPDAWNEVQGRNEKE